MGNSTIGEKIKYYRKKKGITQQQLASSIGVQHALISKYENGIIEPPLKQIKKIANAMEIPAGYLLPAYISIFSNLTDEQALEVTKKVACELDIPQEDLQKEISRGDEEISELYVAAAHTALLVLEPRERLLEAFDRMNEAGQKKAVENITDLAKIPEYQK